MYGKTASPNSFRLSCKRIDKTNETNNIDKANISIINATHAGTSSK